MIRRAVSPYPTSAEAFGSALWPQLTIMTSLPRPAREGRTPGFGGAAKGKALGATSRRAGAMSEPCDRTTEVRISEYMGIVVPGKGTRMAGRPVAAGAEFLGLLTFRNWLQSVTEMKVTGEVATFSPTTQTARRRFLEPATGRWESVLLGHSPNPMASE
jgi:hypothetical protein